MPQQVSQEPGKVVTTRLPDDIEAQFTGAGYHLENIRGHGRTVATNHAWGSAFCAYGSPQSFLASEIAVDMLAEKMGEDPFDAPALWSGRRALHDEVTASLRETWRGLGEPQVVTACSTCLKTLGEVLPEMEARSLWTVIDEIGWPDGSRPPLAGPLAIHDPCTGRRAIDAQRAVRRLAARLGVELRELGGAELTTCCGFGGLASFANPEMTDKIVDRRIAESADDYLTYCAMCRDNFARHGKRSVHLLDLVFPSPEGGDPAARPDPGFSLRRDNRARLKTQMLREVWREDMTAPTPEVALIVPDAVRADVERKLILVEDIARVIAEAEASGRKLKDKATGHSIAALRMGEFTCWAEYEATTRGVLVHRAWGHRMRVEAKP